MKNHILFSILIFSILSMFLAHSADGFISIKKYKVINSPKVCGDKICSEIDEVKAKKGDPTRDIKVCGNRLCDGIKSKQGEQPTYHNSPIAQFKLGIALDLIQCKPHLELVLKASNHNPACISPKNAQKLIEKGWALPKVTESISEEILKSLPDSDLKDTKSLSEVSLSVTPDVINGKQFLIFYGFNWHGFHNVEITISDNQGFAESIRTKTSEEGNLYMPWPVPDSLIGGRYSIYATDKIHDFEMNIPIITPQR
jgi:hypothetical protein